MTADTAAEQNRGDVSGEGNFLLRQTRLADSGYDSQHRDGDRRARNTAGSACHACSNYGVTVTGTYPFVQQQWYSNDVVE